MSTDELQAKISFLKSQEIPFSDQDGKPHELFAMSSINMKVKYGYSLEELVNKYPIISIEDPVDENDWEGFTAITKVLGDKIQLVGDDLFVTNIECLEKGIKLQAGNAILLKLNQQRKI